MALTLQDFQQGAYGQGGELLDWTYYSTTILANGTTVHNLFSAAVGQTFEGTVQTLDLTNMQSAGTIPQAQNLLVEALKFFYTGHAAFNNAALLAFYLLLEQTTVEIQIASKYVIGQWTLQELFGISTAINLVPTTAGDNVPMVEPNYHGIFPLNVPIILPALTTFKVIVTHQTASAAALNGDFLKVGLNGRLLRGA